MVGIILLLIWFIIHIVTIRKDNKKRLESLLKMYVILFLCFLPTCILLIFILFQFFPEGISIYSIIRQNLILSVWNILLIIMWLYTLIFYFRKQKEIKTDSESEEEKIKRRKTTNLVMAPAFVLPLLVFPLILLDRCFRSNCLLLSVIAAITLVYYCLLILLMKKLRQPSLRV